MLLTDRQTDRQTDRPRIGWLDTARAFAIVAVLLVHATENLYIMDPAHLNVMSWYSELFAITGFTVGRLGVPLFLFLTGYLLLDRVYDVGKIQRFWKRNWLGILVTTEIWIVLYDVFLRLFHFQHWSTKELIRDMLFMDQVHMGHMWYMLMIIGVYLCIPFAARALRNIDLKTIIFPLLILSFYAFGIPIIKSWGNAFSHFGDIRSLLDLGFSGGIYGIYIVLGLCVKRGLLHKLGTGILFAGMIVSLLLTIGLQWFSYGHGVAYNVWYDNGLLLLCTLCLFGLFSRISATRIHGICLWLSLNSFGIYLVHFPFIMLLRKVLIPLSVPMPGKVILLWVSVLIISCVICKIINLSPRLGRLLLYSR